MSETVETLRSFKELPDGKCYWEVTNLEGEVLASRTAPSVQKAWSESAHHCKLIGKRRHISQKKTR